MQLGWVDYSRQERETIKELLEILKDSSSVDELGVGIVRDSISDLLYPGTSVLHTRAKYYILVPALFKKAMRSSLTTASEVRRLIDKDQYDIAQALRKVPDEKPAGIIGGRSDKDVKMKPSRIYWNSMRTIGILNNPALSYDDACSAVASYNRKRQNIELKKETDEDGGDASDALQGVLTIFRAPCVQAAEDYIKEYMVNPTLDLTKDEAIYLKEQFLYMPVMKDTLMKYCLENEASFEGVALGDLEELPKMSNELKRRLMLAKEFSNFIYGAYIVYNLVFMGNNEENSIMDVREKFESRYKEWKETNKGLPHREEILGLVSGHEYYKSSLRKFLIDFENAVNENDKEVCSDREKTLVRERELACKKAKAKIGRDYDYAEIQTVPMNFRHWTAQRIISDILKGLKKDNG